MNKVTRIFLNTDLRCQHNGLALVAGKENVRLDKLKPGEHVLFINTKRDKVKMYSRNGVLSYYKQKGRLDIEAVAKIPAAFGELNELTYVKSLRDVVKARLSK